MLDVKLAVRYSLIRLCQNKAIFVSFFIFSLEVWKPWNTQAWLRAQLNSKLFLLLKLVNSMDPQSLQVFVARLCRQILSELCRRDSSSYYLWVICYSVLITVLFHLGLWPDQLNFLLSVIFRYSEQKLDILAVANPDMEHHRVLGSKWEFVPLFWTVFLVKAHTEVDQGVSFLFSATVNGRPNHDTFVGVTFNLFAQFFRQLCPRDVLSLFLNQSLVWL